MLTLMLFLVFIITVIFGVPVGVCLGMASLAAVELVSGAPGSVIITKGMITGGNNFPLIAVPMFILAGDIMQTGGLSKRIISSVAILVGRLTAGLTYVNILASAFFAAISGSSPATVAAIGGNMIPEMEVRGYQRKFSAALTAASGMLGVMIPPSIPFIIYGITANESIGDLFLAGLIPGLIFATGYIIVARYCVKRGKAFEGDGVTDEFIQDNNLKDESTSGVDKKEKSSFWALMVPVIILGGIYGGVFTPTEAAAVAVGYALIISLFVYKEITLKDIPSILTKSSLTSVTCLVMVVMAFAFGRLLTIEQIPNAVAGFITAISDNKIVIILLINVLLILVGMFMDTTAAIIILTPILLPIAVKVGIDPIHFGVIITCNLAIGFCTPPLGINIFVASSISGLSIEKIIDAILPFLVSMFISLVIVSYAPSVSTFLPNLMSR
ncbi:TRAP transporter large permease [Photobacterium sp. DNB23_23_1]